MSLVIHQSGIEAAINAQANGFSGATLSDVDLYNGNTLIKRLPLKGVQVIEPTRIYVVAVDETVGSAYDVTRMEFRTDGNVLYATAQLADGGIIQSKGPYTTLMLTEQINLSAAPGTIAPSGDVSLYMPHATEQLMGASTIASQEMVDAGTDDRSFLTSLKLATRLQSWWDSVRTWANIKDQPETATRWPSWDEVDNKPIYITEWGSNANGTWKKYSNGWCVMSMSRNYSPSNSTNFLSSVTTPRAYSGAITKVETAFIGHAMGQGNLTGKNQRGYVTTDNYISSSIFTFGVVQQQSHIGTSVHIEISGYNMF